MAGKILLADAFDTYDGTLHLYQSPSPYVMAAASFNFYANGAFQDSNHDVFSIVSVPAVGGLPWNKAGNNHYLHVDCTQIGSPPVPFGQTSATNPGPGMYRSFGNVYQALIWGGWFRITTLPIAGQSVVPWRLNDSKNTTGGLFPPVYGTDHCYLSIDSNATLAFVNNNSGNIATKTNFPTGTTWHFLEVFVYIGNLNGGTGIRGSFQVNLDGVSIMSSTNAQTASNLPNSYDADSITLDAEFSNTAIYDFGPYYVMDPQGGGAAAFLGLSSGVTGTSTGYGVPFQTLLATANGGVNQLSVVGAGSNYQAINGQKPNPAVYVKTPTQAQLDRYRFPIFSGFSSAFAIQPIIVAESDGLGSRVVIGVQNLQGAASVGTAHGLQNGTYQYFADVPFTGVTPAQSDTGEWGEELLN